MSNRLDIFLINHMVHLALRDTRLSLEVGQQSLSKESHMDQLGNPSVSELQHVLPS